MSRTRFALAVTGVAAMAAAAGYAAGARIVALGDATAERTSFMMLREGRVHFDGSAAELLRQLTRA